MRGLLPGQRGGEGAGRVRRQPTDAISLEINSLAAVSQLPLLDREYGVRLHRDIRHDATAAGVILQARVIGARRDGSGPRALVVLDRSGAIVLALVWAPAVLARWGHPQLRDRVQCEIPKPDAFALLCPRTTAVSEGNRDKQQAKDFRCVTAQRHPSRKRRSRLRALTKFLAVSSPIGATSRVDARSAP